MTDHLWLNACIIIGIVGAAEEALRRIVGRPLIRTYHKFERFLDAWNGEPESDGLAARPGIVTRVTAMEATLRRVDYHSRPNGGHSAYDALMHEVKGIGRSLDEHKLEAADKEAKGRAIEQEIRETIATLADAVKIAAQSTPPEEH